MTGIGPLLPLFLAPVLALASASAAAQPASQPASQPAPADAVPPAPAAGSAEQDGAASADPAIAVPVDSVAEAYRVFAEGRMAERAREREAAIRAYRRAARLDPSSAGPLIALARLHVVSDPETAEEAALRAADRDPEAAAAHQMLGSLYFRQLRAGENPAVAEKAIASFSAAVRLDPDDLESRSALARLLASVRRGEEAAEHFREIVRRAPDPYAELFLLAQLRLAAGDREQAFDYLMSSLRIEPRQPEAREALDDLLRGPPIPGRSREEALEAVVALYREAATEHPEVDVLVALADVEARSGDFGGGAATFERVLALDPANELALMGLALLRQQQQQLEETEAMLTRLLEINGRHLPARQALGGVYLARCEYDRAAAEFERLLELPRDSYGTTRRRDFLVRLAQARQEAGDDAGALDALEEAVRLAPGRDDALTFRVMLTQGNLAAGRAARALELADELAGENPDNPGVQALHARALGAAGRDDEALAILRALAERHPDRPVMTHELLRLHVGADRMEAAEALARDWLAERPDDHAFRFQLAAILERTGRLEEAEAEFRAILDAVPDHHLSLNYLGYMLAEEGDRLDEAEDLIERALEADPYNGSYLDSLGWVQFRRGALDLAEPNLLRAERCMPENSVVLDHLGDLYRAKGEPDEAVRFWRRALEHDADEELERDAVTRKIEEAGDARD